MPLELSGLRQRVLARRLLMISVVVTTLTTLALAIDHGIGAYTAARKLERIEALEAATGGDPSVAETLHREREEHTKASLGREGRGLIAGWILLISVTGLVAGGKWFRSLEPDPSPSLGDLLAARFASLAGRRVTREPRSPEPPSLDLAFVDRLIERHGGGREAAIPILQAIQEHYRYLPDEALQRVCETTEITPAQIAGTSSFYAQFRRSPVGRTLVRVCHGTACHVAGAGPITDELRRHLGISEGTDTDPERRFTVDRVACLGCCSLAPVMMVEEETVGRLTPATARLALEEETVS